MQIPTILIGLGGTGSEIVDKIYSWLPDSSKRYIAIQAFDTDVNDISKLKNLNKDNITQTSTKYTVGQYLSYADDVVKEWFPTELKGLHRKTLTDGAGQIRAVSRLAYRAAIENDALSKLHKCITDIDRLCTEEKITSVRVMIVTTLAGGTGAGIFLQTAMYIREYFKKTQNRENVLIRGVFILPDTLIMNNTVDKQEFDNLRSNAYACIKELNAIFRVTNGAAENVQIEMEYRPGQNDDYGRRDLTLGFHNLPYDYCVLFDFENEDNKNIGSYRNYKNMVARTAYFDLFSPMADSLFSQQDNKVRSLIANSELSRYCASGLASLFYPYDSIVKYHTLKWVTSFLSDQWLIIDEVVKNERKSYEEDISKGINREPFKYGDRFIKNIEEYSIDKPFFKKIFREVNILDERNKPVKFKSEGYFDELYSEVEKVFKNDSDLNNAEKECSIREDEIKNKDTARRELNRMENALESYKSEIDKFILNNKNLIIDKVISQDARVITDLGIEGDFSSYNCNRSSQLNYWLLNASEPVQPLSVRFILYQLINETDLQIRTLNRELEELTTNIGLYVTKEFDDLQTEGHEEKAEEMLVKSINQRFLNKIFSGNEFKLFTDSYIDKSNEQLSRLNLYKHKKTLIEVFHTLINYLRDISNDFETYFEYLNNIKMRLNTELNLSERLHDESDDPTTLFILASAENKQKQWENIKHKYLEEGVPADISKQIYLGIFNRFCRNIRGNYISSMQEKTIEEDFRSIVIDWSTQKVYKDLSINISCFEALHTEAQYNQASDREIDTYIKNRIQQLNVLSKPFIQKPINLKLSEISGWGVHTDITKHFTPDFIAKTFDSTPIQDDAFSRYEIVKEKLIYGLKAEDIIKFQEPNGSYYRAYLRVINDMLKNPNIITPHLDKRWHLPAYLPSLTDTAIESDKNKINKAFIIGLIMGYLKQVLYHGNNTWIFTAETGGMQIIYSATDTPVGENTYELHNALMYNPAIVDKILDKFSKDSIKAKKQFPNISDHPFYKDAQEVNIHGKTINIFQLIMSMPDDLPADAALEKSSFELFRKCLTVISDYFTLAIGMHRIAEARQQAKEFTELLLKNAPHYTIAAGDAIKSVRFMEWDKAIAAINQ